MMNSPYREYHGASFAPSAPADGPELDLRPALAVFWVASLARAVYAFVAGNGFGVEATLATLVVVAIPVMLLGGRERAGEGSRAGE